MEDKQKPADPPPPGEELGLEAFHQPPDRGLSLEHLSQAFAEMLDGGKDPYEDATGAAEAGAGDADQVAAPPPAAATDRCEVCPRSILEAMLFVGNPNNEPLTSQQVAGLMRGVREAEIDELVRELNRQYLEDGCPYQIAQVGAGYRLKLREEFGRIRDKFYGRVREARLSPAAIEVLALVAYNGPLSSEDVARLRGTRSGSILSQLVRRQLLRVERPESSPRVPHYRTTGRFLRLFGLTSLDDLPRSQELD